MYRIWLRDGGDVQQQLHQLSGAQALRESQLSGRGAGVLLLQVRPGKEVESPGLINRSEGPWDDHWLGNHSKGLYISKFPIWAKVAHGHLGAQKIDRPPHRQRGNLKVGGLGHFMYLRSEALLGDMRLVFVSGGLLRSPPPIGLHHNRR